MIERFNRFLDRLSDFLAHRKGLLPLVGIFLIAIDAISQFFPGTGWMVETSFLLHLGVILSILGILLAWVL